MLRSEGTETLSYSICLQIAYEIALGMSYIHDWKAVHRDLKSANILLDNNFRSYITDFGISRSESQQMTTKLGTAAWMAPELFQQSDYSFYTNSVDVYSFAIVFWEIITRQQPYQGTSSFQIPVKVIEGSRPPIPDDCPSEIAELIEQCWDQRANCRPSFKEITTRLEVHLHSAFGKVNVKKELTRLQGIKFNPLLRFVVSNHSVSQDSNNESKDEPPSSTTSPITMNSVPSNSSDGSENITPSPSKRIALLAHQRNDRKPST